MKKLLIFIGFALLFSCTREDETRFCYSYINSTDKTIELELYDVNGFLLESFEKDGLGLITKKCDTGMGFSSPADVLKSDSIIVIFNDMRKLTFSTSGLNRQLFLTDFYQREGNTRNYTYEFTEEDFNNAEPY